MIDRERSDVFEALRRERIDALVQARYRPPVCRQVRRSLCDQTVRTAVGIDSRRVEEHEDGWFVDRGPKKAAELISDAVFWIDETIVYQRLVRTLCKGHVRYAGKTWPFFEDKHRIERNPQGRLAEQVRRKCGAVPQCQRTWSKRLVRIVEKCARPILTAGIAAVGWHAPAQRLVLPDYCIHLGGEVRPDDRPVFRECDPASGMPLPKPLGEPDRDLLVRDDGATLVAWAVAACVAANIVAPAKGLFPIRIALVDAGAQQIGLQAAAAMGCPVRRATTARKLRRAVEPNYHHAWPVCVAFDPRIRRPTQLQ